ncbi:MAG: RNA polymerase factor sigma-54, partial [Hylemonella sp.]|nr:RNA polymerase factor sigma-54 [Hylemonella sp.]
MKQGLSLRVSQHLALTPQLQQSIRLLQLSTLELNQEIEQLLDENPFLERDSDEAEREAYGLERADQPLPADEESYSASSTTADEAEPALGDAAELADWGGDGSVEIAADDSEWGGDALPRNGALDETEADAGELARSQESLPDHLRRQALALRLSEEDRAALLFLIGSLNDDGYLEDTLEALAQGLAAGDLAQGEELLAHFRVALHLL